MPTRQSQAQVKRPGVGRDPAPLPAAEQPSPAFSQERLRELIWELGTHFPPPFTADHLAFAPIHPRSAYLHWHLQQSSVDALREEQGETFDGARLVLRVYDVTDVMFDGHNAHNFFDIGINALSGTHYLSVGQLERHLLAEVGFCLRDATFCALARSATIYADRDRPSGRFELQALYVDEGFQHVFPVENVMDAPVYERLHAQLRQLDRQQPIAVAVIHAGFDDRLHQLVTRLFDKSTALGVQAQVFGAVAEAPALGAEEWLAAVQKQATAMVAQLRARHEQQPFELVHCHDWTSVPAGLAAQRAFDLPLVLSLHSTEHERAHGGELDGPSLAIRDWEQRGVDAAQLVIVPHSATRHQVLTLYGAAASKVVIVADAFEPAQSTLPDSGEQKRALGLHSSWPVALFAGEMSHAAGADLMVDALINVCREHHDVHFIFAGDGPLRGELEGRVHHAGQGHRCRFLGDVHGGRFEAVLAASDFVVIPARTWQDEGLAQLALGWGKPVLTTHQSQIRCIVHGQNGLVTYDNPGSIVWGLKEMIANPLHGSMLRIVAMRRDNQQQSLDTSAIEHCLAYAEVLTGTRSEVRDG